LRLLRGRGGRLPAFLAGPERIDRLEIVDIETVETVLFWDRGAREANRMARMLQADLAQLELEDFLAKWSAIAPEE
jgi:hypothetical protein